MGEISAKQIAQLLGVNIRSLTSYLSGHHMLRDKYLLRRTNRAAIYDDGIVEELKKVYTIAVPGGISETCLTERFHIKPEQLRSYLRVLHPEYVATEQTPGIAVAKDGRKIMRMGFFYPPELVGIMEADGVGQPDWMKTTGLAKARADSMQERALARDYEGNQPQQYECSYCGDLYWDKKDWTTCYCSKECEERAKREGTWEAPWVETWREEKKEYFSISKRLKELGYLGEGESWYICRLCEKRFASREYRFYCPDCVKTLRLLQAEKKKRKE